MNQRVYKKPSFFSANTFVTNIIAEMGGFLHFVPRLQTSVRAIRLWATPMFH